MDMPGYQYSERPLYVNERVVCLAIMADNNTYYRSEVYVNVHIDNLSSWLGNHIATMTSLEMHLFQSHRQDQVNPQWAPPNPK